MPGSSYDYCVSESMTGLLSAQIIAAGCLLQRLLAHRVAQHYGLETTTIDSGEDQVKVKATKGPNTRHPQASAFLSSASCIEGFFAFAY